jgi:hypothetical protein
MYGIIMDQEKSNPKIDIENVEILSKVEKKFVEMSAYSIYALIGVVIILSVLLYFGK